MDPLKKKIQQTALFTPQEKIDILAAFDTFSGKDNVQLGAIIDQYDAKYKTITGAFKQHINGELGAIEADAYSDEKDRLRAAVGKIRSGLSAMLPDAH